MKIEEYVPEIVPISSAMANACSVAPPNSSSASTGSAVEKVVASEQVEVDRAGRRLKQGQRLTAPDDPEKVSREEFDDLVRDLHAEPTPRRTAVADRAAPKSKRAPKPAAPPAPEHDASDASPEDTVMPPRADGGRPKPKRSPSAAAKRRGKHGRPR